MSWSNSVALESLTHFKDRESRGGGGGMEVSLENTIAVNAPFCTKPHEHGWPPQTHSYPRTWLPQTWCQAVVWRRRRRGELTGRRLLHTPAHWLTVLPLGSWCLKCHFCLVKISFWIHVWCCQQTLSRVISTLLYNSKKYFFNLFFIFKFYFKLYIIVLVLPIIKIFLKFIFSV